MGRLIDTDELIANVASIVDLRTLSTKTIGEAIAKTPTVDAAPVIRCRDCEHKDRESGFCHGRGWPMQLVPDDGFCDKGERKDVTNETD